MLRVPLWDVAPHDSREFLGDRANRFNLVDLHELAAGKLAALLARGASRDLFDARELLARGTFDRDKLRLAFVVYGGIYRVDWRTVSAAAVTTTVDDVRRQLLPMRVRGLALSDTPEVERVVSQTTLVSNRTWAWLREPDRLLRSAVEEGGFGTGGGF